MRFDRSAGRGPAGLATLLCFLLLASACGTRLTDHQIRHDLAVGGGAAAGVGPGGGAAAPGSGKGGGAVLGNGKGKGTGAATGAGGSSAGGGTFGSSGSGSGGGSGSAGGGTAGGKGAGSGGGKGGARGGGGSGGGNAVPASGSCSSGGSTDVGVTGSSVLVGASYAESSLIPGEFRPAVDAIQAYFNMVNHSGGVCGRQIQFKVYNDQLNPQTYGENVRHLVESDKVFAVLGSLSAADSGGCQYMNGQEPPKGAPDIGTFALSYCRAQSPNFYSPVGSLKQNIYGCCAEWNFLEHKFGFHKPAVHYLDVEISREEGLEVVDSLVRTLHLHGRSDVYQGEHSAAQFDYTGDVIKMEQNGVDSVWSSMDLNNDVKLVRAICQQGWHPKVIHLEVSSYDPQFIQRVGSSCVGSQNIWIRSVFLPFNESGNHELNLYLSTLHQYCPDCSPTTFGLEGWLTAKMFVGALASIGGNVTRPRLYQALDSIKDWTGGGLMGPVTPSDRIVYRCNYMLHVKTSGFFRESGLLCGPFYQAGDYNGRPVG